MCGRVHQEDETKLKGTVTQAAKDRTITGTVTVTPSGDMARKAPYDRNVEVKVSFYSALVAAHGSTIRWTYTVPANHTAILTNIYFSASTVIATAGKRCVMDIRTEAVLGGGLFQKICGLVHYSTTAYVTSNTWSTNVIGIAGAIFRGYTDNNDTVSHYMTNNGTFIEFDE